MNDFGRLRRGRPSRPQPTEARPRGHGKEGQRRFVHDSPLEEGVSSELVSEAPEIPC
jgi:hypothetical protein